MLDDEAFLAAFEAHALPLDQWHHLDHIRVAFLYLRAHGVEEGIARIRGGIQGYNAARGVQDALTSGYHETVTQAWARLVAQALRDGPEVADSQAFAAAHPELLDKRRLRRHYTPDQILTLEAKRVFVEPDLEPLP